MNFRIIFFPFKQDSSTSLNHCSQSLLAHFLLRLQSWGQMDREAGRANQPPAGHRLRGAHNKDQPPFPKGTLNCQPWQGKLIFTITWIPSLQHNVNRIPLSQLWTQEMLQAAVPQLTSLCREKVHQGHGSACVNLDYTQMWTKCFKLRSLALTNHLSFSRLRHKGYCDEHYLRFMGLGCLSFT